MIQRVPKSTLLLGGAAALLIGILVVESFLPADVQPVNDGGGDAVVTPTAVVALPGAPPELSDKELRERYQPVLEAGLFSERDFRDRPKWTPPPKRDEPRPQRREPPPPDTVSLRLTSMLGEGQGRHGVLEEGGTGKGWVARLGAKVGDAEVAAVHTYTLVVKRAGKQESVDLGGSLTLPASARSQLEQLSKAKAGAKKPRTGVYKPKVELTETKKMSILERLKAQRAASMNKKKKDKKKKDSSDE